MVEKDIILAKTAIVQRCLQRIKDTTHLEADSLSDFDVQDIFVLNLQRGIQATIDIATHVIASEGWDLPDTQRKHFFVLSQRNVISPELSDALQRMVGFRNIAVHDYQNMNLDILKSILEKHLMDLENFCSDIISYFQLNSE